MEKGNCHYCGLEDSPYVVFLDKHACTDHAEDYLKVADVMCQHSGCTNKAYHFVERTLKYMCKDHKDEGEDAKRPSSLLDEIMGIPTDLIEDPQTKGDVKAINDALEKGPSSQSLKGLGGQGNSVKGLSIVKENGVTFAVPMEDTKPFFVQYAAYLADNGDGSVVEAFYLSQDTFIFFDEIAAAWTISS